MRTAPTPVAIPFRSFSKALQSSADIPTPASVWHTRSASRPVGMRIRTLFFCSLLPVFTVIHQPADLSLVNWHPGQHTVKVCERVPKLKPAGTDPILTYGAFMIAGSLLQDRYRLPYLALRFEIPH